MITRSITTTNPSSIIEPPKVVRLLLQCTECIAMDNLNDASDLLPEIPAMSPLFGTSPERVAAYFADVLQVHIANLCLGTYSPLATSSWLSQRPHVLGQ
ncbi:hypothetical protein VitviT2T_028272 [Vitis vinifera]|uniref:Uncharacterized protein n=1 Tax=Vitis vinifera TaxID=29760 RepID=A0ABY9DUG4_VITVI|nr:hypothetical protein VitviT2T_028272 [Vitis vinifera]